MLKEFTLLNDNCDLFSQVVLCFSQQQKKLGMQPCMNLGSSLETCATLMLVPRQSQVEFVVSDDITKQGCFPDANQVLDRGYAKSLVLPVEAESSDRRSARRSCSVRDKLLVHKA